MTRLALAVCLATPAAALPAQTTFTPSHALDLVRVAHPAIAPDGKSIVFTRIQANRIADRWEQMLWQIDDDGRNPRQVAPGHHAAWSPDGKQLAWLVEVEGVAQLMVRNPLGATTAVTAGATPVRAFRWSPDGQQLAFTRLVPVASPIALAAPVPVEGGHWAADPTITTRLRSEEGWVQLFVVAAAGGDARQVTAGGFDVGARDTGTPEAIPFDWTADGRALLFDGSLEPDAERRYQQSHIYAIDVSSGALRRLTALDGFWHTPVASPDGRQIVFSGHGGEQPTYRVQQLHVIRPDGGGFRTLTSSLDRDAVSPTWDSDNQTIWFSAEERGTINSWSVSTKDAKVKPGSNGLHRMELAAIARKGGYGVSIRSTATLPWELVRFPIKKPWEVQPLTRFNESLTRALQFGEVEELEFRSGGALIHGWLVKPPSFVPGTPRPLFVEVHGGPHAMHHVGFAPDVQLMAAAGNLVLLLNPRGSTGYGAEFGAALGERYPGVDLDDLLAGVDDVVARGWVDTTRIAIGGCGAGGMTAAWAIGRSRRFAAASVRCPGNDWLAVSPGPFGTETAPFFALPWRQDRLSWGERAPLRLVGDVRAPTLVIAGDCRRSAPYDEGAEWFAALQLRGVPSALVRLQDECGAATIHPSNWLRTRQLVLDWYRLSSPGTP
jgi:dipeptidyl aminopeptidase/acylaminoacyl peptidase